MKRFLKNIGYFVLPIMFLSYAADVFLSSKLKESKTHAGGEYSTWSDLYKGNLNANILIYGSSRAQVHVSPLIISDSLGRSCYNLGLTGHNFWAQYFRHKELLKYPPRASVANCVIVIGAFAPTVVTTIFPQFVAKVNVRGIRLSNFSAGAIDGGV